MLHGGESLPLDGNIGAVHAGRLTPVSERPGPALAAVAAWLGRPLPSYLQPSRRRPPA